MICPGTFAIYSVLTFHVHVLPLQQATLNKVALFNVLEGKRYHILSDTSYINIST